jgi:hypothetical protein
MVAGLGRYDVSLPPSKNIYKALVLAYMFFVSALAAVIGIILLALVWESFYIIQELSKLDFIQKFVPSSKPKYLSRIGFAIGVPLILEVISLTVVIRMALLGRLFPDERREWWGRMGARLHRWTFIWLLITGAALIGVLIVNHFLKHSDPIHLVEIAAPAGWIALIGIAVRYAFSSKTSGDTKPSTMVSSIIENFVQVAPYIFGLGFLIIASNVVYWLLGYPYFDFLKERKALNLDWSLILTVSFLALTSWLIWSVGVNEFSMHHFYRNRLVRAYLGGSRRTTERERSTNYFTGFDKDDDLKLATLTCAKGYHGPFLIINTTLNATQVSDLDRQDRKAESFVFTPLYCGFDIAQTRASANMSGQTYDYGYRRTKRYASGPTLGTPMAISGAAANPNQGHHSSSATAFLLTAFNVRLGWWIGNPRRRSTWKSNDPPFGLAYVIYDLIGRSSTHDKYVCLSDGGHFDNMGLYELVRRKSRLIVLADGEQDDKFICEGLANAIRRCRIDFGVEITIDVSHITNRSEKTKFSSDHYAIGRILYPGDSPRQPSGILLYLKSTLTGDEPTDIREYSLANPEFPHQSTGDQFFNESQFESYRRLGLHIIETAMLDPKVKEVLFECSCN